MDVPAYSNYDQDDSSDAWLAGPKYLANVAARSQGGGIIRSAPRRAWIATKLAALRIILCRHLCVFLMGIGLLVDLWQSPLKAIPSICSADMALWTKLLLHFAIMPAAHCGMLLGGILSISLRSDAKRSNISLPLLLLLPRMAAIEAAALILFSPITDPVSMMAAMALLMMALGHLRFPGRGAGIFSRRPDDGWPWTRGRCAADASFYGRLVLAGRVQPTPEPQ